MTKVKAPKAVKVNLPTGEVEGAAAPRTFETIQNEFASLCARAGYLQYQVFTFNKDLDVINDQVRSLNFEAAALKAKEAAQPKAGV